jgi:hypothetical protein
MGGSVDDRMAEAIQLSDTVLICVSEDYKHSSNCRIEADYAKMLARRGLTKVVFLMMNEHYTTVSSPKFCDGWLGIMIGTEMWYPLWTDDKIAGTAKAIAQIIGDAAYSKNGLRSRTVVDKSTVSAAAGGATKPPLISSSTSVTPSSSPSKADTASIVVSSSEACEQVWNTLHNEICCTNQAGLLEYLIELGITSKEDLPYIDDNSQAKLVTYLKKVSASKVTVMLNRLRSETIQ